MKAKIKSDWCPFYDQNHRLYSVKKNDIFDIIGQVENWYLLDINGLHIEVFHNLIEVLNG